MADNDVLASDVANFGIELREERGQRSKLEQALAEQALLHQQQTEETMRQLADLQATVRTLSQPTTIPCRTCNELVTEAAQHDHEMVHELEGRVEQTNERFPQNAIRDITEKHTHLVRRLPIPNTLVIASGIITRGQDYHLLEPETGTSDNLDKIRNGFHGAMLALRNADSGDTISVRHNQSAGNGDNILLNGDATITLDEVDDMLVLLYDQSLDTKGAWIEWNGSGGSGLHDQIIDVDGDTKIQVEEGADDDTIRFDIAGTEEGSWNTNRFLVRNPFALLVGGVTLDTNGLLVPVSSYVIVDGFSGASTDNLDQIEDASVVAGTIHILQANTGDTITVRHDTGSDVSERILLHDDKDFILEPTLSSTLVVIYTGTTWRELCRSGTATTTQEGFVELATTAEANTGTDETRAITPNALKDSRLGILPPKKRDYSRR